MKLMICIKSCEQDKKRGFHDLIRQTYGKDLKPLGIDLKFFVGKSFSQYQSDEVHLNCPDDYNSLPFKTREICKWASGKVLDYIYLADTDTFLIPKKMLESGFEGYDYVGKIDKPLGKPFQYEHQDREGNKEIHPRCFAWASGGFGYFLSKRAFTYIAYEHPSSVCEDLWVGQAIGTKIAEGEMTGKHTPGNQYSFHSPSHGEIYEPKVLIDWMQEMYRSHH